MKYTSKKGFLSLEIERFGGHLRQTQREFPLKSTQIQRRDLVS